MRTQKATAQVVSSGRVTIPEAAREVLDIEEGDFVEIEVRPVGDEDG